MTTHFPRLFLLLVATGLVALLGGCDSAPTDPFDTGEPVTLALQVASMDEMVEVIVVEVTGNGIPVPILANLVMTDGNASGSITVPAGQARTFTARGFDAEGGITHEGSITEEVRPGQAVVRIPMVPRGVGVPIEVVASSYVISIEPENAELDAGQAVTLAATVRNAEGSVLDVDPGDLTWASSNPAIARVERLETGDGEVTGWYQGTAQVGVSYDGVAAHATVVVDGIVAATVSAGFEHTCGLTISGTAYCWGNNSHGRIGDGTTIDRDVPTAVSGNHSFASVSAGFWHTCGTRTDGAAYCWGTNYAGQLGDGTTTDRDVPIGVTGDHSFGSVSAGNGHTCGTRTDGAAYCWGLNSAGQIGDGSNMLRRIPTAVSGSHSFISLSVGTAFTCGTRTDGAAYCWGNNVDGRLGDGTTTDRSAPAAVSGDYSFASLSAGKSHTCGKRTDGAAYCWGHNGHGQIGDGTTTERHVPTAVNGDHFFATLSAGDNHTCGTRADGTAYCWGRNGEGQLADGTTTDRPAPGAVSGDLSFASVSGGGTHTCGTRTDGAVYCWGSNRFGQLGLGDGTAFPRLAPTAVSGWTTLP